MIRQLKKCRPSPTRIHLFAPPPQPMILNHCPNPIDAHFFNSFCKMSKGITPFCISCPSCVLYFLGIDVFLVFRSLLTVAGSPHVPQISIFVIILEKKIDPGQLLRVGWGAPEPTFSEHSFLSLFDRLFGALFIPLASFWMLLITFW